MDLLQNPRTRLYAGVGAGAALLAGVLIAVVLNGGGNDDGPSEAAAGQRSLQVELGETPRLDPDRQLRCFVGGQLVGTATLAECARRNGVAAQALDVGLDESGVLAAGGDSLQPLPQVSPPASVALAQPPPAPAVTRSAPSLAATPAAAPVGECLRYAADGWRPTGGSLSLSACVQTLFAGRCERAGGAQYGRWSGQTLRLVPGRVEVSADNRDFHTLAEQGRDCSIPPL